MFRSLAVACIAFAASLSHAQGWPSRPVKLVVPFPAGGPTDVLSRVVAERLSSHVKQPVVVENKPGAGGSIGADLVAKSAPDGHTVLFAATSFAVNPAMTRLPFDPRKSFAPVALVATSSLAVLVNPSVPAGSMREFVALAKASPGKLHYGSPGSGGVQHLAMELIKLETGIDVVHVPYKGLGGATADVIGGHVQAMVAALQSVAPHVQSGKLRMLAVLSAERAAAFPGVPTLREQGVADLEVETWYAALAPAGTPAAVIGKLNAGINAALMDSSVRASLEKQGMAPGGGDPARMEALLQRELARWARVVNAAGIKAD